MKIKIIKSKKPIIQMEIERRDIIGPDILNDKLFLDGYNECIGEIIGKVQKQLKEDTTNIIRKKTEEVLLKWWTDELNKVLKN